MMFGEPATIGPGPGAGDGAGVGTACLLPENVPAATFVFMVTFLAKVHVPSLCHVHASQAASALQLLQHRSAEATSIFL
jgi:hypothetical protein